MGARSYVPSLGRFLTPDPIFGGSANPNDYANQDPINEFDLEGTCSTKKKCAAKRKRAVAKVRSAASRIRDRMREAREARAKRGRAWNLGVEGGHIPKLPWEKEAEEALDKVENSLVGVFTKDCGETADTFLLSGAPQGVSQSYCQKEAPRRRRSAVCSLCSEEELPSLAEPFGALISSMYANTGVFPSSESAAD
jgi:hypothetical protein